MHQLRSSKLIGKPGGRPKDEDPSPTQMVNQFVAVTLFNINQSKPTPDLFCSVYEYSVQYMFCSYKGEFSTL